MNSLTQITANRQNAEKSTGPSTDEGKAVVSRNAIKHGLLSSQTVLPWEDAQCLGELSQNLHTELQPKGELERILVDRVVSLTWRLRRAGKIEAAILAVELHEADLKRAYAEEYSCTKRPKSIFGPAKKERIRILDKRKYAEALRKQAEIRLRMNDDGANLGRGYIKQAGNLMTLHRYETTLERSLFKALHELQRVQAMRLGIEVTLPMAVDVQGDGVDL